ncbi:hypothetical protein GUITHDRAFT_118809 [Guillardia theta CCMP2712]|uniref:Uncharacterized protein n=1 Tax=Guillardia theta (strain CCMP2712) TaxID=905079 RepID=L1IGK6_GUITC|nr:hypothetical protein GUITHDRAFT_118809 [Guillardia theta CCMP2712]EKX34965.1 hypothetical protein GUITHDRAFT_118809 [Guillardia theta CCMP2712]|eukprot:XP_005821945.1 hypothetical protein GUITHDRAFT_118809 [Guillardia theta CCMP2712]
MNAQIAYEIYSAKRSMLENKSMESALVAAKYGISSKTVRDIWDRRTWADATIELWTEREREEYESQERRNPGRPPGSKDTKPRKKRGGVAGMSGLHKACSSGFSISDNTDNNSCRSSVTADSSSADDISKVFNVDQNFFQDSDEQSSSGAVAPSTELLEASIVPMDVNDAGGEATRGEAAANGDVQTLLDSEQRRLIGETYRNQSAQLLNGSSDEWFVRPELCGINDFLQESSESSDT